MDQISKLSHPAQDKWDRRYAGSAADDLTEPTPFVASCLPELPTRGRALDIAAGAGRHSLALARRGLVVDGLDISWQGLRLARQRADRAGLSFDALQFAVVDVELPWLPDRLYEVVVVSFFLYRPLFPLIKERLKPGGRLLYETRVKVRQRDTGTDPNKRFWLKPRELLDAFSDFDIVRYDEGYRRHPNRSEGGVTAQLLALKPG